MIAVWMLYCFGIGVAFCVVGCALERALHYTGRLTRWAWVIALIGSYLLPVAAWLRPDAFATFAAPIPVVGPSPMTSPTSTPSTMLDAPSAPPSFSLSDLDTPLRWGWGLASVALLSMIAVAAARLVSHRRRWRQAAIDGRLVLVSRNIGPAVVGVWEPRVVLPEWALALPTDERELMLAHEEQHIRARDPALLAAGFLGVLLAPWNPALWWQWRRLRLTVEMDCDARVLAQGRSAPAYGVLLLKVGRRRATRLLGAAALGEPVSFLESRIRRMLGTLPPWRWAGAATAAVIAAGALVGACEMPRPMAPPQATDSVTPALLASLKREGPSVRARLDSAIAEREKPWIRQNLSRLFPRLLRETAGPPMDVFFMHDAGLLVSQGVLVPRKNDRISSEDIQAVFKSFRPGNDGWTVVNRLSLQGLVRDNVRVIRIHHDPAQRDLRAFEEHPEMLVRPWVRQALIVRYPSLLSERVGTPVQIWFVIDANKQILRSAQRRGAESIRVGLPEIRAAFPDLPESSIGSWGVMNRRALGGLVRDNVYVVWVQLRSGASVQ